MMTMTVRTTTCKIRIGWRPAGLGLGGPDGHRPKLRASVSAGPGDEPSMSARTVGRATPDERPACRNLADGADSVANVRAPSEHHAIHRRCTRPAIGVAA